MKKSFLLLLSLPTIAQGADLADLILEAVRPPHTAIIQHQTQLKKINDKINDQVEKVAGLATKLQTATQLFLDGDLNKRQKETVSNYLTTLSDNIENKIKKIEALDTYKDRIESLEKKLSTSSFDLNHFQESLQGLGERSKLTLLTNLGIEAYIREMVENAIQKVSENLPRLDLTQDQKSYEEEIRSPQIIDSSSDEEEFKDAHEGEIPSHKLQHHQHSLNDSFNREGQLKNPFLRNVTPQKFQAALRQEDQDWKDIKRANLFTGLSDQILQSESQQDSYPIQDQELNNHHENQSNEDQGLGGQPVQEIKRRSARIAAAQQKEQEQNSQFNTPNKTTNRVIRSIARANEQLNKLDELTSGKKTLSAQKQNRNGQANDEE